MERFDRRLLEKAERRVADPQRFREVLGFYLENPERAGTDEIPLADGRVAGAVNCVSEITRKARRSFPDTAAGSRPPP